MAEYSIPSDRLQNLLTGWRVGCDAAAKASPSPRLHLVPHLAAASDLLLHDACCSLNLANIPASREFVRTRAENLFPPRPEDPWPAPDPVTRIKAPTPQVFLPGEIDPVVQASLDGYLACQREFKLTVMHLLEGGETGIVLRQDLDRWYQALMEPWVQTGLLRPQDLWGGRTTIRPAFPLDHTPPPPAEIAPCLELLLATPALQNVPFLVHLGLLWIQPWTRGNGRMARMAQSALMLGGGHPWPIIPGDRREAYLQALQVAFTHGDSSPLVSLYLEA